VRPQDVFPSNPSLPVLWPCDILGQATPMTWGSWDPYTGTIVPESHNSPQKGVCATPGPGLAPRPRGTCLGGWIFLNHGTPLLTYGPLTAHQSLTQNMLLGLLMLCISPPPSDDSRVEPTVPGLCQLPLWPCSYTRSAGEGGPTAVASATGHTFTTWPRQKGWSALPV
jgi:hypothetical protein